MADGTSIPVGAISPARNVVAPRSSLKKFSQRRSTVGFLLCLPLLVLPWIGAWSWRLKRVITDGVLLYIDDTLTEDKIALNYIGRVVDKRGTLLRVITLSCDRDTPWGQQIQFLAPLRGDVPPREEHPTATALRGLTQRARG